MDNCWLKAFVDETGTSELDSSKQGVSHLFICVAVIVDDAGYKTTNAEMMNLSKKLCSGAEIMSSRIGGRHELRLEYLRGISDLPFGYYALVINKNRIPQNSGIKYKTSFYKYINRMLYQKIVTGRNNLSIIADEIGGQEFMSSFKGYLEKHGLPDLFLNFKHAFANSGQTPLIQLADLIAGSLSYCFDDSKRCEHSTQFREILKTKEIGIDCWPKEYKPISSEAPQSQAEWNERIKSANTNRAIKFIDKYGQIDDTNRCMQISTLNYLLFASYYEQESKRTIYSAKLIEQLESEGFKNLSRQVFSSSVIGKIRDEGIIISGSSDGYRLALSTEDIHDYLKHDRSIIEPMLHRLSKARESIKMDTINTLDIFLSDSNYLCLMKLVEEFSEYQTKSRADK